MIHGVRTITYHVDDLAASKAWYTEVFEKKPYFDEPFYVGFNIDGFELGLLPVDENSPSGPGGVEAHWGVDNMQVAYDRLIALGGRPIGDIEDVGGGILVAKVLDPSGNSLGIIYNPEDQK